MKSFSKATFFLASLLMAGSIAGVSATFRYAVGNPQSVDTKSSFQISPFNWEGAEELPHDSIAGKNHLALIERIVDSEEGLNTASSHLNDVISERLGENKETASSVSPTRGGTLKKMFNTREMEELHFLLYFTPDENGEITEYQVYTFERSLLGSKEGTTVQPVYKTTVVLKSGGWDAVRSWHGKATTVFYDTKQGSGKDITIDPSSWEETPHETAHPQNG